MKKFLLAILAGVGLVAVSPVLIKTRPAASSDSAVGCSL
jgi:hypothetical protein